MTLTISAHRTMTDRIYPAGRGGILIVPCKRYSGKQFEWLSLLVLQSPELGPNSQDLNCGNIAGTYESAKNTCA